MEILVLLITKGARWELMAIVFGGFTGYEWTNRCFHDQGMVRKPAFSAALLGVSGPFGCASGRRFRVRGRIGTRELLQDECIFMFDDLEHQYSRQGETSGKAKQYATSRSAYHYIKHQYSRQGETSGKAKQYAASRSVYHHIKHQYSRQGETSLKTACSLRTL
jgi:hypothetical protein